MFCPNLSDPKIKQQFTQLENLHPDFAYYLWDKYEGEVPDRYYQLSSTQFQESVFQTTSSQSIESIIASEKTIRDLAARMSNRIGISVRFESDRTKQYKGKLEGNTAVINLAYATLDTPIHEILGHPIIRAIKNRKHEDGSIEEYNDFMADYWDKHPEKSREEVEKYVEKNFKPKIKSSQLYQNLLKELETGRGKEVLDRIKKDYKEYEKNLTAVKSEINRIQNIISKGYLYEIDGNLFNKEDAIEYSIDNDYDFKEEIEFDSYANLEIKLLRQQQILEEKNSVSKGNVVEDFIIDDKEIRIVYNLEKVQEEAIVELLGLYTADKLNAVEDGKLISLLKRLLKEMKAFMRSLINQKEVEIDKLPDNMTLGDLSDLLAYSNSKLIFPGNEVEYTTPDNMKFKTYQEASNHISQLAKSVEDVDLSNTELLKPIPFATSLEELGDKFEGRENSLYFKEDGRWKIKYSDGKISLLSDFGQSERQLLDAYNTNIRIKNSNSIQNFIEKNKEYEQSKEIIEEWKKVNNIKYNPEEIYSRGQEFSSVVGAYSDFDVNLMMQNLLQHIEDNQKAGGEFTISAFTKPIDKKIGHLDGGGGKIKFKIYPQSQNIKWAANADVFSGSVWDASTKINKDKKSELLGVSYTKYPSLRNVNKIQPNLASIVDNLEHHHNELAITLTGNNFRLEYDEDIPYQTKKIIDGINKILDQKYGKLVKPEIKKVTTIPNEFEFWQQDMNEDGGIDRFRISIFKKDNKWFEEFFDTYGQSESIREIDYNEVKSKFDEALTSNSTLTRGIGIQPTQTKDNLKESIESVKDRTRLVESNYDKFNDEYQSYTINNIRYVADLYTNRYQKFEPGYSGQLITKEEFEANKPKQKEYTSQALINTKISKLKEVAKKYPRSLIRSEVKPIFRESVRNEFQPFDLDDLPFQKISSTQVKPGVEELFNENPELASVGTPQQYSLYLNTIFPDSKVKDIVYRGSAKGIEQDEQPFLYFSDSPNDAFLYSKAHVSKTGKMTERNPISSIRKGLQSKYNIVLDEEGYVSSPINTDTKNYNRLKELYPIVKIESENDLMKQFDDADYIENIDEYKKIRKELEPFFNIEEIGKLESAILNIKNPLDGGMQEDLKYSSDAYKNGHDGATLLGGKHFVVRKSSEQIHILGNKQDIEGFKDFVSQQTLPSVMDSRIKNEYADEILSKYLQQEKFKEVVAELIDDFEYKNLPYNKKSKYIQRVIFNKEIRPLESRKSIEIVDGYRVIIKPTKKVFKASANKTAYQNFRGYAYSIANNLNKTYAFTYEPVIAKLEYLDDGKYELVLNVNTSYYKNLIDFIDTVSPEVLMAEIEAVTLLEKAAEEAEDHLRLMRESQTIVVDGEVLPFFGELYDSRLESGLAVNNAEYEKIGKVLNFLSSKFKGVSWSFNSYLDKPAQINLLTGEIQFNPALITSETPWHEFGHVIVRNIRQNNPELFEQLKSEIKKLHNENPITSSYAAVEAFYPEYGKSDSFWEEAITTELGRQADVEYRNKENKTIWQTILDFFKGIFDFNVTESTKMKDLVDNLLSKEEVEFISSQYAPGLQEKMFARFTRGMKIDMLSKAEQLIPDDEFEFASFGKKIKTFASTILDKDIKGILATAKNIRSEKTLIQESIKSLERIKNLITNEDVAEAYYELATYLKSSNGYLRQIGNAIRLNKENPDVNNKIKIMALHSAHKQAVAFEAQINVLVDMMSEKSKKAIDALTTEEVKERNQNVVLYSIASIKSTIAIIKNEYDKGILDPLSEELLPAITKGNEELKASYQKQIETVKKSNVSDTVKTKRINDIQKKINEVIDTKEKVKKLFTDPKKTLLSNIYLDSAFLSNDPTINIVANYIKEGIYDQIPEVQKMNNELQSIQSEITEMLGPNPRAVVDRRSMYSFLVREVKQKYVEDGELKTKNIFALNGKTKTVELQNEITRLKYELEKATTPEEVTRINNLIDSFYENYTERPFTEEYYQVANSLPLEIRRKRNEIYSQINALRNTIGTGNFDSNFHSDYEAIEMIKELQSELDDMERLYDYKGNKKTGYELEVAESIINWKKDKRSKNLVSYKLTEQSKSAFEIEYQRQLNIYENNLALAKTEEEKRAAQESWDAWRSINVRTTYTQEFYDRKEEITFRISQLLGSRGNLTEAYDKLFNILKGQRDSSGVYIPSNYSKELIAKSKEIELEIEEIKKAIKADSKIDPEVKAELIPLFKELDELQSTVNSSYYTQTRESIINEIRSEIASRNPNIEDEELNRLTHQKYTSSDWYKENHIIKNRWSDESQSVVSSFEPIFVWRVTRPNNPEYVEQNQPGFVWYKSIVNPEFHNPKYKQGEIQFKEQTSGEYFNQNYNNLTDKQKSIVEKVRTLHYANQKGLYSQDKLGDIIPGMLKSGKDRFIDFVTLGKNPFSNTYERIKNWFQFKDIGTDDTIQTYGETQKEFSMADYNADNTLKASKKLFMRFSKPIDAKDQSYDILGAIANYGGASYQFRALRNIQATVLAANRTVENSGVKNMLERVTDKILYGQTLKGNDPLIKSVNAIGRMATGFAGRKSLGFNLLSIPQNLATGFKQNFTMMFSHGLSFSSLRKGTIDSILASKDFFLYHSQLGAKPKSLQLLEFFATEQQNYFTRGSNITSTGIRKWGNILNTINTIREFTEFEIAAQVGFAHLNQYRIKLKDSDNTIPLKDAFEIKDGTLQLKPNVENDQELISFVRNRIYVAQRRAQGIYDTMSQPEADRYALGKLVLFLKKWVVQDIKSIYGGSTIHYGAGLETEGSWSAFGQLIRDSIRYKNPIFAYNTATDAVKGGAKKGTLNFSIWLGLINILSGLRMMTECEEDNNADWADYSCYFLKRIINEVEGGFTLWGMNETMYTYGREKSNGITLADKLFGAVSGSLGITGRYFTDIDQYANLDPYYRTTGGNIDWDKTHPMLAGKPALAVGAIEYFGLRGLDISPESIAFNNRRFEDYMPKTYGKDLKTKFTKDYELEEVQSRTIGAKTTRMFKKQYKELTQKRDIKLESGADVTSINNQIDILRRNYDKRMREFNMEKGKTEKESFLVLPTPFFSDKLNINKEIDTKDLE